MVEMQKHHQDTRWRYDYPMVRLSSWGVGGVVARVFNPTQESDLAEILMADDDILFVGYGSNLLVRDGGYKGTVVRTAPGLATLRVEEDGRVFAAAGVGCPKLARFCVAQGLLGSEFFVGIPGTVGGALAMNAGCHGSETWQFVEAVSAITQDGKIVTRQRDDFVVSYRQVESRERLFFTGAWFRFDEGDEKTGQDKLRELLRHRSETQPIGEPTAGSVFCNPPDDYAGRLLEESGMKGVRVGGAEVSTKHANFIVTHSGATAADVENLIQRMQQRVMEKTGVCLRVEVCIVGEAT